MTHAYDPQNIFARILRGEIPNRTVLDTAHTLAFHDISPAAPVHVLVIPKGPYVSLDHFAAQASAEEITDFHRAIAEVCRLTGLAPGQGFRAISNTGANGQQEVPHYHVHLLGGRPMGPMVQK